MKAVEITTPLVRQLVGAQLPMWSEMTLYPVAESGWDNRTFRLGQDMAVRLPSAKAYAAQLDREQRCLPRLAGRLSQPIPESLATGEPQFGYPWNWSVYRWLEGETALPERIASLPTFARDLASFLRALQAAPTEGGPPPGRENFYRGGSLAVYDSEARKAIAVLGTQINARAATAAWESALMSLWARDSVWVHGDVAVGNLLVSKGRLCGVIDFGQVCIGDPACDLAPAWTLFDEENREIFRAEMALDSATWARGRGWALWKALIVAAGLTETSAWEATRSWNTIESVLTDHARTEA